jgi:hypothetical protein
MASTVIGGSAVAGPSPESPVDVGTKTILGDYTTLSKVRTYLSLASAEVSDDDELRRFITRSSRSIDRYTRRHFYPLRRGGNDVLRFDLPRSRTTLEFDDLDVLQVHGLSDMNGASEIDASVYWLKCGDRWNLTPYDRLEIDLSSGSLFNFSGTDQRAIHVDTLLGYHESYDYAWVDSNASLTSALGTATTLASVSGSGGMNTLGVTPRFSEGQLWRLGSGSTEEFVYAKDTINTSSIRILRAVNGTSRTSHASATKIYIWQPEYDIEDAATEVTAFAYHKAKSPFTNKISVLQLGIIEQPEAWPERTLDKLSRFKKDAIHSF